ncbi:MAG: hypothetical protein J2P28_20385 [Actinobacteria bacterium]|nr:hypothetical protein [Actinomycetota bacterium]
MVLTSPDSRQSIGIDVSAGPSPLPAGTYAASYLPAAGNLDVSLDLADVTGPGAMPLYLATSGTVTVNSGGRAGTIDAWLGPETGPHGSVGPAGIHLTGRWTCPVTP